MTSIDWWTILVGVLAGVGCSLVGCFLVLRKMSLLGDAISHAVLPGIALGFLLSGKIAGPAIVLGAMVMGLLTAYLTQALSRAVNVAEDASLGVVFTTLFALGVVLISVKARSVDLDPGCVLYGLIEFTPFDTMPLIGFEVPAAVITLGCTLLMIVLAIAVCWKELKLVAFDPQLATSLGYPASTLHYFLMALTAGITVAAFEAVGSILVVAMLIVPAATAQLLTDRLRNMLILASLLATLAAVFGYLGAMHWNTSVAGMMAVVSGGLFLGSLLLAPRYGIMARMMRQLQLTLRIYQEDVLGSLYRAQENAPSEKMQTRKLPIKPGLVRWYTLQSLKGQSLIKVENNSVTLTDTGKERALQLIRAHRLWETYLQKNVSLPEDHLHAPAEKMEHYVGPVLLESMAEDLKKPTKDPHGRDIPL